MQREEEKIKREIKQYAKKDPAIVKMLVGNVVSAGAWNSKPVYGSLK